MLVSCKPVRVGATSLKLEIRLHLPNAEMAQMHDLVLTNLVVLVVVTVILNSEVTRAPLIA